MTEPPAPLVQAWQAAATDLGIEVQAPYLVGDAVFAARVLGFGSARGTLVDWMGSGNSHATADTFYVSCVDPKAYGSYDRRLFQETLDYWGWAGDLSSAPGWYTGRQWSE